MLDCKSLVTTSTRLSLKTSVSTDSISCETLQQQQQLSQQHIASISHNSLWNVSSASLTRTVSSEGCSTSSKIPILESVYSSPADAHATSMVSLIRNPLSALCLSSSSSHSNSLSTAFSHTNSSSVGSASGTLVCDSAGTNSGFNFSRSASQRHHDYEEPEDTSQSVYSEPVDSASSSTVASVSTKTTKERGAFHSLTAKNPQIRGSNSEIMLRASLAAGAASSPGPSGSISCSLMSSGGLQHHPLSPFEPVPRRRSPGHPAAAAAAVSLPNPLAADAAAAATVVSHNAEQGTYEEAWDLKLPRPRLQVMVGASKPSSNGIGVSPHSAPPASSQSGISQLRGTTSVATSSGTSNLYDHAYSQGCEITATSASGACFRSQSETAPTTWSNANSSNSSRTISSTALLQQPPAPPSPNTQTARVLARLNEPTAALDTDSYSTDSYDEPWDTRHQRVIEELTGGVSSAVALHTLHHALSAPAPPVPPHGSGLPNSNHSQQHHHLHQRATSLVVGSTSAPEPPSTQPPFSLQHRVVQRRATERSQSGSRPSQAVPPVAASVVDLDSTTTASSRLSRPRHSSGSMTTTTSVTTTSSDSLNKQIWFHGNVTRSEAEVCLAKQRPGSFLVRRCESNQEDFSLSIKGERGFLHMKINRNASNHYVLGQYSQPYSSIPEMIHHYSVFFLPIKGADQMILQNPVAISTSKK